MNVAPILRSAYATTTEERVWAVLSHLSSLAFGMGIVLPIVGWSEQRRKSNYASFQCLQALGYQSLGFTIWVLSSALIVIILAIAMLASLNPTKQNHLDAQLLVKTWTVIFGIVSLVLLGIYSLLPIVAAIACGSGKDFRYPILGNGLANYLAYSSTEKSDERIWLNEGHEFHWVAAMGHFSILLVIWGMLAPLTVWALYGKRSPFLKFQSVQTLIYQATATVLFLSGLFLYLLGLFFLLAGTGILGGSNFNSSFGIVELVILGGLISISALLLLFVPFLHILGQWAGYRVLKGEDYSYPFVGRLVRKWISKHSTLEEKPT